MNFQFFLVMKIRTSGLKKQLQFPKRIFFKTDCTQQNLVCLVIFYQQKAVLFQSLNAITNLLWRKINNALIKHFEFFYNKST